MEKRSYISVLGRIPKGSQKMQCLIFSVYGKQLFTFLDPFYFLGLNSIIR